MKIDFLALLKADAALIGLLTTKSPITYVARPDLAGLSCITLTQISDPPNYTQGGRNALHETRIQSDVWANTYAEATTIEKRLTAYLEGIRTLTFGDTLFHRIMTDAGARDMPITDLPNGEKVYQITTDYQIHYQDI